ncbi:MAG: PhoH family protein [Planctomycetota bacterium]|nr:PhoH family protein [Planctomycetota bacterium]
MQKCFVLDTNVLLHNPNAMFMFAEHEVILPLTVIEELDGFKGNNDDTGRNARQVIRELDKLRRKGRLFEGVPTNDHGGLLRVMRCDRQRPFDLDLSEADNRILSVAHYLKQQGRHTVFITKDINARVKGDALELNVEDFDAEKVDADWLYMGYDEMTLPGELIDTLYEQRLLPLEELEPYRVFENEWGEEVRLDLLANQCLILQDINDPSHTGLARVLAETEHLIPIAAPRKPVFGVAARNVQQIMALDLLLDDEIKLVSLLGSAGTGKTLLALAAGMHKVYKEQRYEKLLTARPIMPLGRDIGYLPGDKDEKLQLWMQPVFDNLSYLLSTRGTHLDQADSHTNEQRIESLMSEGKLVMEPLTYIRGRSIPHQFMVVDEVQNLTPHEVKTIVSRAGEGTKIVLTGDIDQIDNPYLDASSNGLSYLVERMKGKGLFGHVTLAKTERSILANLAAKML